MIYKEVQSGYVALLSVLIVGAVALATATVVLVGGSDSQRESLAEQQNVQARNLATACGEDALQQMHDNTAYTATNVQLTLGQGTCVYTVTNTGGSSRTIDATGTVGNIVRKIKVYVTINATSISVTAWQEVS